MIITILSIVVGLICAGIIGWILGFRSCARLHDEVLRSNPIKPNPADKIRIPATRSTDLVPEKIP